MIKGYSHRYGIIVSNEYKTVEEAIGTIRAMEDDGKCFGDCVTKDGIIVHDFDANNRVIGREQPESRVGEEYPQD